MLIRYLEKLGTVVLGGLEKIGDVVGQRGKTINAIIDETGVKIDITDDGAVSICGTDQKMMDKAIHYIQTIVTDYKEGQIFTGKVVSIKEFGAFLEFAPGKEGMVHISEISYRLQYFTWKHCYDINILFLYTAFGRFVLCQVRGQNWI